MAKHIFAARIKEAMDRQALTQAALAAIAGCDQSAISDYTKGRIPSGEKLVQIAKALGTTAESLLGVEPLSTAESAWKSRAIVAEQKLEALKSGVVALVKKY